MKFTLSWLKEHLETDATVQQIADKLNSIGLEVEAITDPGASLKDFIVGEIITAEKHPNADKLRLCSVSTGKENLQIVCGAPNARAGIKVVLARPGNVIPATGDALKIGTVRGVESRGMMCSARELLLGEDHDGIIELNADARAGEPVAGALEARGLLADDPVIEVSITPNRGDAASVWGVARDLAAAGLGKLKGEKITPVAGTFPSPKTVTLDFALARLTGVIDKLLVYPDNMLKNLNRFRGLVHSQRVLLALTQAGLSREDAYRLVQRNAMKVWEQGKDFLEELLADKEVTAALPEAEIREKFDLGYHTKHVDTIFRRVFGESRDAA